MMRIGSRIEFEDTGDILVYAGVIDEVTSAFVIEGTGQIHRLCRTEDLEEMIKAKQIRVLNVVYK